MILTLVILLFLLMSLIGGNRGGKSFAVLLLNTITAILSMVLIGKNFHPIVVMLLSSLVFITVTVGFQNGYNIKSLATILSIGIVLLFLCTLIYYICTNAHVIGLDELELFEDENSYISSAVTINMLSVLVISMLWGLLGAVADTSMAISTTLNEINHNNPSLGTWQLIKSGMSVGKDILGTTINTLIFVGLGESILLVLAYINYSYSLEKILNSKSFLNELSCILISCMGCLMIIPITAILFSLLVKSPKKIYSKLRF
ncbi:MAG: YibE/F family protein [Lachnospiraceae bacterium]